jgi:hypothetical protein
LAKFVTHQVGGATKIKKISILSFGYSKFLLLEGMKSTQNNLAILKPTF